MKFLTTLLLILFTSFCLSQNKNNNRSTIKTTYVSLKDYHIKHPAPLTQEDSLNIIIVEGKQLIKVNEQFFGNRKGTSVEYTFKDSTFLDIYKKTAFNHKNDSISKLTKMKYWKDDIKIFFSKSIPKKTKKQFFNFATSVINEIDSLKIKEVKKVEDSNYIVYYSDDYEYNSRMSNYKYSDSYCNWKSNSLLYKASIKIMTDKLFNETLRLNKMKSLFILTLGYFKFNEQLDCKNYFSGCYQDNLKLTDLDIELLKYHYDFGICKGTTLETFEKQHKKAKETLKKSKHKIRFLHPY